MEHYLQQLDKINQYLDFTDVNAFPKNEGAKKWNITYNN